MDWWALALAAGLCLVTAAAEGLLSGNELPRWLASLKRPRLYAPLPIWIVAAVATYVIQGVIAYRLLRAPIDAIGALSVALLIAVMIANVAYNVVLDRTRRVRVAYLGIVCFVPLLAALQTSLFFADRVSAALNLIYVLWVVGYDLPVMRALWRLNRPVA
jgi:tryptophan-rich sensory protein